MVVYIPARDVAKLLRADLKEKFPGTKFSVRTDHGSTLNVSWTDGPATKAVDAIADKYAGQGFDGMQDMRYDRDNGTTEDGEKVSYLTDFVFLRREISDEADVELRTILEAEIATENNTTIKDVQTGFWPAPQTIMRETGHAPEAPLYSFIRILAEHRAEATA